MPGNDIKIRSSQGGSFDGYLALPQRAGKVPAIVVASAVHGVNEDTRGVVDEFAAAGYIALAPDLFWRSVPGPLPRDDPRTSARAKPRGEKIRAGEADMADARAEVERLAQHNGRTAVIGLCYGGPYAILGPKRLGYAAGVSCHGSAMNDFIGELAGVAAPVCIMWGDEDHAAPPEVLAAYRALPPVQPNVEVHVFPGVQHGYMLPSATKAYSAPSRAVSMRRTIEILKSLEAA